MKKQHDFADIEPEFQSKMNSIDDLRNDVAELEKFMSEASRQRVKSLLTVEIHKIKTEISKRMDQEKAAKPQENSTGADVKSLSTGMSKMGKYPTKIMTYAWDQSDKFFKIYVTLNGVQNIPKENVVSDFTDRSFKLEVNSLAEKDYICHVVQLFDEIIPEKSYHKVKSDMVLIMLKKKSESTWGYVTKQEAKEKQKKAPAPAGDKDPQAGLMDMMKQMYEDGDDEMKRTITKAMYESQNKKSSEMPGMEGMGGMGGMMGGM